MLSVLGLTSGHLGLSLAEVLSQADICSILLPSLSPARGCVTQVLGGLVSPCAAHGRAESGPLNKTATSAQDVW